MAKKAKLSKKEILDRKNSRLEAAHRFRRQLIKEMLKLSTSGFGLVAALAWNEVIKETVSQYIKPLLGEASGLVSLLIYAVVVTILAVSITFSLANFMKKD